MKSCRTYRDLFIEALYGELKQPQMQDFQEHLNRCTACRAEFKAMKSVLNVMSQKKKIEPEPVFWTGFWNRLANRMEKGKSAVQSAPNPLLRFFKFSTLMPNWGYRLVKAAAMIAIGIFIGYLYFSQPQQNGESLRQTAEKSSTMIQHTAINRQALEYLERSKIILLGMVNLDTDQIDPSTMDFSRQREISRELIAQAAVFKEQLKGSEYLRLMALISELEMIMLQICNYEEKFDISAIDLIKSGVENQAILLKINLEEMMLSVQTAQSESKTSVKNKINL